jgi:hypothetical protein
VQFFPVFTGILMPPPNLTRLGFDCEPIALARLGQRSAGRRLSGVSILDILAFVARGTLIARGDTGVQTWQLRVCGTEIVVRCPAWLLSNRNPDSIYPIRRNQSPTG